MVASRAASSALWAICSNLFKMRVISARDGLYRGRRLDMVDTHSLDQRDREESEWWNRSGTHSGGWRTFGRGHSQQSPGSRKQSRASEATNGKAMKKYVPVGPVTKTEFS